MTLRGPLPGPGMYLEMAKQWNFPPIVKTPDQAIAYLDTFRSTFPKDAPVQNDISAAQGWLIEQKGSVGGGPF